LLLVLAARQKRLRVKKQTSAFAGDSADLMANSERDIVAACSDIPD
jgi:hypothetical protein